MHYSVRTLRDIDDINELLEEASHTVSMLLNEASNRDSSDMFYYVTQAEQVLDLLRERIAEFEDQE